MNNFLKKLNELCFKSSILPNNRLVFEFKAYEIVIDLKRKEGYDYFEERRYNYLESQDFEKFKLNISSCLIASSEYLGWRENLIRFDKPVSISRNMYAAVKIIKDIDSTAIKKYRISQNEGYDQTADLYTCDLEPNYIYEIHINEHLYSNIDFFKRVVKKLNLIDFGSNVPQFYWSFYKGYKKIEDSKRLSIVNTNTKVRRLGYFKLLSDFIGNDRISANLVNKKFERFVSKYNNDLGAYKNNKGLIKKTKRGTSAKPYIDTAKNLSLLNLLNKVYSPGKLYKVYKVLKGELKFEEIENLSNPFYLTKLDKLFFFETILREDFLYTSILLELVIINEEVSYKHLLKEFQPSLILRLNEHLDDLRLDNRNKAQREIKKVIERVNSWKEAEVYLEHIIMPRLNWYLDLELLEIDDKLNISSTLKGKKLFDNVCYWNDINWSRIINPHEFISLFIIHVFDSIYSVSQKNSETPPNIKSKINYYLTQSFEHFQTIAPNRVTASQAITYVKYKLYFEDNLKTEHRFIVNYLKSKEQNEFVYKFQKQYGDGYIQKIR